MAGESSGGDSSQQNAIDRLSVVFDRIYGSEYRAARRLIHKRLRQKDMGSPGKKPPAQRDNSLYLRIMAFRHKESPGTSPQPSGDATPPRSQQSNRTPQRQSPQANKTPQRTPPQSNRPSRPQSRKAKKYQPSKEPSASDYNDKAEDPTTARDVYVEMGDEERDSPKRMSRNQSRQDDLPPVREATPRRADRPLSRAASDLNKHSVVPPINKEDDSRNSRNSRHSTPDQRQSSRPPSNQNRTPSRNNTPSSDDARATILSPRNQPKPNTPPRMEAAVPSSSNADDQPIERAGPSNVHSSRPDDNPTDDYDDDDDSPEPDIPARTPKVREEDGRIAALEKLADYNLKTLAGQDAGEAPEIDDKIMNEVFSPEFQKDLDNFLKS
ncbi:nucleolar protein dao-5-like isoform X4 [Haliotis rufescens]|uniref:nucleolar protein dao-5-like isoform X4 n=1 Tax=Haliotis rufescens TaxID=6454 RepID=UPI00201F75E2|nr:nucleolar protein dao-5-like isoform X4 [Haliotis rufescens]